MGNEALGDQPRQISAPCILHFAHDNAYVAGALMPMTIIVLSPIWEWVAGAYWQDPVNNWRKTPGPTGYDLSGFSKLTFWVRGQSGGEVVQFLAVDGCEVSLPVVYLTALLPLCALFWIQ